jgi:hypothetical protein
MWAGLDRRTLPTFVYIFVQMLDSSRVETRGTPDQAVDFVTLFEQEFGEI